MEKVSVIIPAYNEGQYIGKVIDKIRESAIEAEIVVVDNCSTDNTFEVAKSKQVISVYCGNRGKGYAMEEGLKHATGDIIVFMDGDLQIFSKDIVSLMVNPIINENIEFTKSAFIREGGRVTELVAKPLMELTFGEKANFKQPLSGIIAGKIDVFKNITLEKDYGVDVGILLDVIKLNYRIQEVDIGKIENASQPWEKLSKMSKEVAAAILKRANYIK